MSQSWLFPHSLMIDWRRLLSSLGEETITSVMLGELQPNLSLRTKFLALARKA